MITVKGRELIIPRSEQQIGTPYDNNAEVRHIRIDRVTSGGIDIANLNYRLDLEYANDVLDTCLLDVEVQEEYILLTWTIPDTCLTQKGTVWIAVRAYDENGSIKWATNRGAVYVGHTIFDGPAYTGKLSELEQLEERITQKTEILDTNESERKEAEEQRKANEERRVNNEAEWQRQAETAINTANETLREAKEQAGIATQKATESTQKAKESSDSATAAAGSAATASEKEAVATQKAKEASDSATAAAESAAVAGEKEATATQKAKEASDSATAAAGSAAVAGEKEATATQKAKESSDSATAAAGSAVVAGEKEATATQKAAEAKNSADDAKRYAEQCAGVAGFDGTASTVSAIDTQGVAVRKASGTGHVTMTDAAGYPLLNLDLTGKSGQVSTTGAQLFDANKITIGKYIVPENGAANSGSNEYCISEKIYLAQGDYILTGNTGNGYNIGVYQNDVFKRAIGIQSVDTPINITVQDGENAVILTLKTVDTHNIMFSSGTTAKPWEPYTGGKPSPSPEYPQPIISTGTVSTGGQLFDSGNLSKSSAEYKIDGSQIIVSETAAGVYGGVEYILPSIAGKTVTASGNVISKTPQDIVSVMDIRYTVNGTTIYRPFTNTHKTIDVPADATHISLRLIVNNVSGAATLGTTIFDSVMLNMGSTPLPWEPYTGGKPSPSPDYPQTLDVTVTGAQLMDTSRLARTHNDVTFSVQEDGGILVTGNTLEKLAHTAVVSTNLSPGTYYVSGSVPAADPKIFVKAKKWYSDGKSNVINDASFIVDGTESKIEYFIYIYQGVSDINEIVYPMLNAGPTALPYQPYQSRTATIALTEPLRGIGDVRDRIMCRDGAWGVERQFVSLTFDGSENWGKMSTNSADKFRFRTSKNKSIIKAEKKVNIPTKILCDRLQAGSSSNTYSRIDCISSSATCDIYIYMEQFSHGDVDAFKAYLSAHPLNAMFERATPTWEPLPSAAQSALNALTTYTGTTHVTVTAGGPEPDVGLEYFGQPGDKVTVQDMCDSFAAPGFDDSGVVEEITSFQSFYDKFVSGMKISDFFRNLKAGLKFVLHTGQLVNNGLCNEPGKYPLDAAYGRTLLEMIGNTENLPGGAADIVSAIVTQNSNLKNKVDINDIQKGSTQGIACDANVITESTITYPVAFNTVPKVVASFYSDTQLVEYGKMTLMVCNITKTSFMVRIANASDKKLNPAVYWIARK